MAAMEGILFLWSVVLGFWAVYAATRARLYSAVVTLVYNALSVLIILAISGIFSY